MHNFIRKPDETIEPIQSLQVILFIISLISLFTLSQGLFKYLKHFVFHEIILLSFKIDTISEYRYHV